MRVSTMCLVLLGLLWPGSVGAREATRPMVGRDRIHVVHSGQTLYEIARHYGLAADHVARANGLPAHGDAPVGKTLMIPGRRVLPDNPPRDGIVVNLPERGLYLFRGGSFVKFYPIAIGLPTYQTPRGTYKINALVKNPAWLPPEWAGLGEVVVPPGEDNPLGDRWIGLNKPGVGLHAAIDPLSVGESVSHGCMRMLAAGVHELFERVKVGFSCRIDYETAKLGWDPNSRGAYLAVFPDVYGLAGPKVRAPRLIKAAGLFASPAHIAAICATPSGRAELASPPLVAVSLNGQPAVSALSHHGMVWVPAVKFRAAGLPVTWDAKKRLMHVGTKKNELVLRMADSLRALPQKMQQQGALPPGYFLDGHAMLPASHIATRLGVKMESIATGD